MTRVADVLPWAETPERQNPFVFVVGCPRSGTTLLQRMLDNHPELAVAHDSHFIPLAIKNESVGVDPQLTPELVTWVTSYRRFHRLQLSEGDVAEAASRSTTYSEFVGALYTAYARAHGKRLAGEKTPDYVRYLPQLHALFPSARFIHIIRDGRDVALSVRDWAQGGKGPSRRALWDEEPIAVCALWWSRFVSTGFRDGAPLGRSAYREVLYERLVEAPVATLTELAEFLCLPDSPAMAAYHVGKTHQRSGRSSKSAWLPPTSGLRDWRSAMAPRDRALFELLAGEQLSALGYELSGDPVTEELAQVADRCRTWWETRALRHRPEVGRG